MSRQTPGRLSPRLVFVWGALALAAVAIALIQRNDSANMNVQDNAIDARMLLPAPISEIGAIEILNRGTLHRFERGTDGTWFYHGIHAESQAAHEHKVDPEAAARIDKAMIAFGRARKEREFPLNVQADEFGVTRPHIFIMAYLPKAPQPMSRYAVGTVAPDGVSRYVLPVGNPQVVTIPDYQIDNLLGLIASFEAAPSNAASPPGAR